MKGSETWKLETTSHAQDQLHCDVQDIFKVKPLVPIEPSI